MKFLVCGEGPNDIGKDDQPPELGTLQAFVCSIRAADNDKFERHRIAHLGPRRKSKGFEDKLELAFKELGHRNCDALVFVVDSDKEPKRVLRLKEARDKVCAGRSSAVGTAIRSIEAWLLSDEKALASAFGCPTPATTANPEELSDPKSLLHQWLDGADRWDHSAAYAEMARQVRLEIVRKRCPRGFADFAVEVEAL